MFRAIIFAIVLVATTIFWASATIIVSVFYRYSPIIHKTIVRSWSRTIVFIAGIKVKVYGKENIQPDGSYIVISNHQSHIDIPVLVSHLPLKLTFLAKKELFKIPFFGWAMQAAGLLRIDRSNRQKAIQTLRNAEKVILENNLSVMSFPEGTRSLDGNIHPFKKGPFVMAINTGLPLLPISIRGTYDILPKKKLVIKPGIVRVRIHPPVEPHDYSFEKRNELVEKIHQMIVKGFYES